MLGYAAWRDDLKPLQHLSSQLTSKSSFQHHPYRSGPLHSGRVLHFQLQCRPIMQHCRLPICIVLYEDREELMSVFVRRATVGVSSTSYPIWTGISHTNSSF